MGYKKGRRLPSFSFSFLIPSRILPTKCHLWDGIWHFERLLSEFLIQSMISYIYLALSFLATIGLSGAVDCFIQQCQTCARLCLPGQHFCIYLFFLPSLTFSSDLRFVLLFDLVQRE